MSIGYEHDEEMPEFFVGRQRELAWIDQRARERGRTLEIVGPGGVGKTALVRRFLQLRRFDGEAIWIAQSNAPLDLDRIDYLLREVRSRRGNIVVVDYATLDDDQLDRLMRKVFNWKVVRTLFVIGRTATSAKRASTLEVGPLDEDSSQEIPVAFLSTAAGIPLAIRLIAEQSRRSSPDSLASQLQGLLYDVEKQIHVPRRELIAAIKPRLVIANDQVLKRLQSRPEDIHQIGHRKFEELIAELLSDMDFDVELTPATRDGGRDVLAYWNSPIGRLLCLVEAKKYRSDRPVGISLVRNLYGTLMDEQATSAMLVTTADFSPDARKFEQRHKWQIGLKNYTDLVEWIENYKKPKSNRILLPS
jgi:HJR/Mrr/RecB family endonuclease